MLKITIFVIIQFLKFKLFKSLPNFLFGIVGGCHGKNKMRNKNRQKDSNVELRDIQPVVIYVPNQLVVKSSLLLFPSGTLHSARVT